VTVINKGIFKF